MPSKAYPGNFLVGNDPEIRGGATMEEVAQELGITKQSVYMIEQQALAKLYIALCRAELRLEDFVDVRRPDE